MFTHRLGLSEAAEAYRIFDAREDGVLKVLLDPTALTEEAPMADLHARWRRSSGDGHVLTGDAIGDDYTHDEALTATPQSPAGGRAPGRHRRGRRRRRLGRPSTACRSPPAARAPACPARASRRPTASSCRSSAWPRSSRSTPTTTSPWCSPASRSTSSTRPLPPHGLVYPVFPGENSASLGGNVATNAGGMRAVKYGVTRHQVLGLDAVLGTGEVIRTGGKFVKATTGYDLTQLIIGSEGTLALVTEATCGSTRASTHGGHGARPVRRRSTRSPPRCPAIVGCGLGPTDPRVHRLHHDGGDHRSAGLELGVPEEIKDTALAYLVVVLENRSDDRLEEDTARAGRAARRASAPSTSTCCPPAPAPR